MRSYVLIEAAVGKANDIARGILEANFTDATLVSVEAVTGPFDVIARSSPTISTSLAARSPTASSSVDGVQRTTTCLVVRLGS